MSAGRQTRNTSKPVKKKLIHFFALYIGTPLIWVYLKFVQFSAKMTVLGEAVPDALQAEGKGHLFVFWHNRQFILPLLRPNDTVYCLISESRDGTYMTALIKLFGKQSIRGSSSRNGLVAMKETMRLLRAGRAAGIATDGPRGPAFEVKPGVVQMAQAMQVPIIPVSYDATNKKVLKSWDNSFLLYPFGEIVIVYGEPIWIKPDEEISAAVERVRIAINSAGEQATALLHKT
ncbi:MAG: lysophospholipid acyltransferase family protein [Gammaproteobacteria bacterium]|nr:lysophospholipid acyltransferase family protein [Gammaproteobacteria bacterium]